MRIAIVSGSHRKDSQSEKVARWLKRAVEVKGSEGELIVLGGNPLPLWDEAAWKAESDIAQQVKPYLDIVAAADAIILVTPEWHGMAAAGLKNFLLYLSPKVSGHKPCLLVGVSASRGGAYPISELRMNSSKNNRILYIPEHLIVQDAVHVMQDDDLTTGTPSDQYIKKRAYFVLDVLMAYAQALAPVRTAGGLLHPDYPNGM